MELVDRKGQTTNSWKDTLESPTLTEMKFQILERGNIKSSNTSKYRSISNHTTRCKILLKLGFVDGDGHTESIECTSEKALFYDPFSSPDVNI